MEEMVAIITTGKDKDLLLRMAKGLLEKRLIACAQLVGPVESLYWWEGEIEEAAEWIVLMKTRRALYDVVEQEIAGLHPYDVPEIVSIPVERCLPSYGRWLEEETSGPG